MSKVRPNEASSSIVIAIDARGTTRSSRCSSKRSREADNITDAEASSKRSREADEQRRSREAHSEHLVMTDAEARRLAKLEGLSLLTSDKSSTGYRNVVKRHRNRFQAYFFQDGKMHTPGTFGSAPAAALAYARHVGPEGCLDQLGVERYLGDFN